jgi:hypothetical protein
MISVLEGNRSDSLKNTKFPPSSSVFFSLQQLMKTDNICPCLNMYVADFYRGYNKKADFVLEIGFLLKIPGGEAGIRTLGTFRHTRFPSVRLKPLGHLSAFGKINTAVIVSRRHFSVN